MTRLIEKRCTHCKTFYVWHASGPDCFSDPASEKHCGSCNKAIQDTLATIPKKYECRYEDVQKLPNFSDITLDIVLEWEKEGDEEPKSALRGKRIWPGLFNTKTGDAQNIREVRGRGNRSWLRVRLQTWKKDPEYKIELPMEFDLLEGKYTGDVWL
jgi:hypothetical protein